MKAEAKNPTFCGTRAGVWFNNGVGYTDDEHALRLLERQGFTLSDEDDDDRRKRQAAKPESVEPRRSAQPNRDALVRPEAGDNGIPVNAGEGDPHAQGMTNPGVHDAVGGRGQFRTATSVPDQPPGDAPENLPTLRLRDTAAARASREGSKPDDVKQGKPVDPTTTDVDDVDGEVAKAVDEDDPSAQDPNATTTEPVAPDEGSAVRPSTSANKSEWVAYAVASGYDESEGLTKDELVERYG